MSIMTRYVVLLVVAAIILTIAIFAGVPAPPLPVAIAFVLVGFAIKGIGAESVQHRTTREEQP